MDGFGDGHALRQKISVLSTRDGMASLEPSATYPAQRDASCIQAGIQGGVISRQMGVCTELAGSHSHSFGTTSSRCQNNTFSDIDTISQWGTARHRPLTGKYSKTCDLVLAAVADAVAAG